ncbi:dual 3',5'-cyclic-AMP and -GMP phosphodiesterase 11 [Caerostris extrusa]|uniref:Dual 3',5'-cyclic-AMP and -GMP phosphodiesterase 11 n=1 Tax=Caerostris extrusa TaxID=172846 RepID=A0AAV4NDQ8_CAEEX|nr:dual 3',5'-cyclic-AMP and -GMP phosphodiesterase 11 [Caerostris extrusa]
MEVTAKKYIADWDAWCLVSQLFDASRSSTLEQIQHKEEICIPWGTGIAGHVAEYRETLNIPDCYKKRIVLFSPRTNKQKEFSGFIRSIQQCSRQQNPQHDVHAHCGHEWRSKRRCANHKQMSWEQSFTDVDQEVFSRYLQLCSIGLRNAELYERAELENKRNKVLLDLVRIVFEEQSTIGQIIHRTMVHAPINSSG